MKDLNQNLIRLKNSYRKLFSKTATEIEEKVLDLKPNKISGEIFDNFADDSAGKHWQQQVLNYLDSELKKIKSEVISTNKLRQEYTCSGCGICCKFAVSEFSPEELKLKAQNGDKFAQQFTSIFVPYETPEQAYEIFPQYLDLLKHNQETDFYIYHCPKITKDNRCSDYQNRPQICRDFPDNPIAFLPPNCGFKQWKALAENISLKFNIFSTIADYYKSNIFNNKN